MMLRAPFFYRSWFLFSLLLLACISRSTSFSNSPPTNAWSRRIQPRCVTKGDLSDFSGHWKLDLKSSEKMKPMLKACGINSLLIEVLERLGVEQNIVATMEPEYKLSITIKTRISSSSFCLYENDLLQKEPWASEGGGKPVPGPLGGNTRALSKWGEGPALYTRQFVSEEEDLSAGPGGLYSAAPGTKIFVTRRYLHEDGNTLYEDCIVQQIAAPPDLQPVTLASCRRILRRKLPKT